MKLLWKVLNYTMENRYKQIEENIKRIRNNIYEAAVKAGRNPHDITLMAVTKTRTCEEVNKAISCGINLLGENRVQEYLQRAEGYDKAEVHLIGHLQTNKVKQIVGKVSMIESVDSIKLAKEIDKQSKALGIVTDVLMEINIGQEDSKNGINKEDAFSLAESINELKNIKLKGLMTIPPKCDEKQLEYYFDDIYKLYIDITNKKLDNINRCIISMGMSSDYELAIKHGSNIVRVGTGIFGQRPAL